MNKVILLVLLMPLTAFGQIMENFESGNLSGWIQSPEGHWNTGNTNPVSGIYSLHHCFDNIEAGCDRIGLSVRNLHPDKGIAKWNFIVRHGYDPSASNNWAVFLMSDCDPSCSYQSNPGLNGYAVGVNLTGYDDTLRLWKIKNGIFSPVVSTRINWQTDIGIADPVKINVERSIEGDWSMNILRLNNTALGFSSGKDKELFRNAWFIISYRYTSTRDMLLWIDDITIDGVFYEDNEPPEINACKATGNNSLLIDFNEEVSEGSLSLSNFCLNEVSNKAIKATRKTSLSIIVEFEEPFLNKLINKLIINCLCDNLFNCKNNYEFEFTPVSTDPGDVIISEIMADPFPAVSLPAKEYIEIFNRTRYSFNTRNWSLSDGNTLCIFPEKVILPGDFMILCQFQDTSLFRSYGKTTGFKSFPALTDGGKVLFISDSTGNLIHGVDYSSEWYGEALKTGGGWSLEIIDTDSPFFYDGNWHASVSREGGTPGMINSVNNKNPDIIFSGITNVFPIDSVTINMTFSEPVFNLGKNIEDIETGGPELDHLFVSDPLMREYILHLMEPLHKGMIYTFRIGNTVEDFTGNLMQRNEFRFGIPVPLQKGNVLFNELLFNPFQGDPDYIEFFNSSDRIIDASGLLLVSVNDELNDTSSMVFVSNVRRCILPGDYYAVTTGRKRLLDRFYSSDPKKIFETSYLPSMPDDAGHLVLYGRELDKIDEVFYNENMHYSLLGAYEGISLEKIRATSISWDRSMWHSASEASGWGTPGAPNSVLSELPEKEEMVKLSSTRITPDNDGNEDFLVIDMKLNGNGNVVSAAVFDETGSIVKKITDNMLAGSEASIVWNGTAQDEKLVSTGIYIILINIFDDTGKVVRWKRVCTVIR